MIFWGTEIENTTLLNSSGKQNGSLNASSSEEGILNAILPDLNSWNKRFFPEALSLNNRTTDLKQQIVIVVSPTHNSWVSQGNTILTFTHCDWVFISRWPSGFFE
jgi:hypothetical protein